MYSLLIKHISQEKAELLSNNYKAINPDQKLLNELNAVLTKIKRVRDNETSNR